MAHHSWLKFCLWHFCFLPILLEQLFFLQRKKKLWAVGKRNPSCSTQAGTLNKEIDRAYFFWGGGKGRSQKEKPELPVLIPNFSCSSPLLFGGLELFSLSSFSHVICPSSPTFFIAVCLIGKKKVLPDWLMGTKIGLGGIWGRGGEGKKNGWEIGPPLESIFLWFLNAVNAQPTMHS